MRKPKVLVCCFSGWARKEADKIAQRIEVASKHFGKPQHLAISPPESYWYSAEFENEKFRVKVKNLLPDVGVVGGCLIFHGFRFASLTIKSLFKKVFCMVGDGVHTYIL